MAADTPTNMRARLRHAKRCKSDRDGAKRPKFAAYAQISARAQSERRATRSVAIVPLGDAAATAAAAAAAAAAATAAAAAATATTATTSGDVSRHGR